MTDRIALRYHLKLSQRINTIAAEAVLYLSCPGFKNHPEVGHFAAINSSLGCALLKLRCATDNVIRVIVCQCNETGYIIQIVDILFDDDCQAEPFGSPFTYFAADITVDGQLFENAGVRKKGFLGSLSDEKPSLKIKFDEFEEGVELFGYERLTLNNNNQDPARIKQCLTYKLFADAGLITPRCNFAHVVVNGRDMGIYTHVESVKKRFLSRHFDDNDGMLFEGTLSDFRAGWDGTFEAKTNRLEPDFSGIDAVTAALSDQGSSDLRSAVADVIDTDQFLQYWAMETLVGQVDGYAQNANNFFIYRDPADDRFRFIPWGVDGTFGGPETASELPAVFQNGILSNRLYSEEGGRDAYFDAMSTQLDTVWDETALRLELDRMEALLEDMADGDILHDTDFADEVASVRDFILGRRRSVEEAIDEPPELEEPRDSFCFESVGSLSGTFATTANSAENPNPFVTGTGTLDMTFAGSEVEFLGSVGANAGVDEDDASLYRIGLVAAIDTTPGAERFIVVTIGVPLEQMQPGTIDLEGLSSLVLEIAPATNEFELRAFISRATLTLEAASTEAGAEIRGGITGELFSIPF